MKISQVVSNIIAKVNLATTHMLAQNNPHSVTASQVGAYSISEADALLSNQVDIINNKISSKSYLMDGIYKLISYARLGVNFEGTFTQNGWTYVTAPELDFPTGAVCYNDDYVSKSIQVYSNEIIGIKIESNNVDFLIKIGTSPDDSSIKEVHSNKYDGYAELITTDIEFTVEEDTQVYITIKGINDNIFVYSTSFIKPYGDAVNLSISNINETLGNIITEELI